ncbi:hypothetical protein VTK56DRAFT_10106 [Thermocarpiscus australiensis]
MPHPPSSSASAAKGERSGTTTTGPPPPPPPLPPPPRVRPSRAELSETHKKKPSPYLDKLADMAADDGFWSRGSEPRPYTYEPVWYFFYGTLMKPDVYGYELTNWGQYKALVDSEPGMEVTGCAYKVRSVEEEFKLAYYETNAYKLAPCRIYFTDGPAESREEDRAFGKTFKYAGNAEALKQGRFDRDLWEMQMGRRLPPAWRGGASRDVQQRGVEQKEVKGAPAQDKGGTGVNCVLGRKGSR